MNIGNNNKNNNNETKNNKNNKNQRMQQGTEFFGTVHKLHGEHYKSEVDVYVVLNVICFFIWI